MSTEHIVKFHLDLDDGDLCLDFHLSNYQNWYKRAWVAIKYVFGYKSKYGDFDEIILKDEDVDRLMELLIHQKKTKEEISKNRNTSTSFS
jgi:hypothetical protein